MPGQPTAAFTIKASGRLRELVTEIAITNVTVNAVNKNDPGLYRTKALWDTGATNSCVTESTAKALGIAPISKALVHHAKGQTLCNVYLVNIYLPNNVALSPVRVTECADNAKWGVIVGMDIITAGDFALTNVGGKTVFSYRFPSIESISFVKNVPGTSQSPVASTTPATATASASNPTPASIPRVGRNDKCPCGSGKKYKNCHGQ